MSYHELSSSTLSADERRVEALKIIEMLQDYQYELHTHEADMIARVKAGAGVSVRMLYWLRDIKDRVIG